MIFIVLRNGLLLRASPAIALEAGEALDWRCCIPGARLRVL
jgi:hypothetical protein